MKIFIDTANFNEIKEVHSWGILAGVTTNPSLVAREGRDFIETVHQIAELVQGPVSAEVVAQDLPGMLREGRALARVHPCIVVKVPLTPVGISACKALSSEGIKVNVTLCFQPGQALFAALAGATYISPFVGRVDDIGWSGTDLVRQIVAVYANDPDLETQVLAASIRHPVHLIEAALAGAHVATVPFKVLQQCMLHPLTDRGNEGFLKDWEKVADKDVAGAVERFLAKR